MYVDYNGKTAHNLYNERFSELNNISIVMHQQMQKLAFWSNTLSPKLRDQTLLGTLYLPIEK